MVASRSARERKAAADAGPLATVRIDLGTDRRFVYKLGCATCTGKGGRRWSTYRPRADNSYLGAMDRWILHLDGRHADAEAPCLTFLPQAQARLHERRASRTSGS